MVTNKNLIIVGAVLTLLGTYVFAIFQLPSGQVGSGLGFAMRLFEIIELFSGTDVFVFYVLLVIFIGWLASGVLQLLGLKSRIVGIIFSLFPLVVGVMYILVKYTEVLGIWSSYFFLITRSEHFGDIFPILVPIGDLGLGIYLLLAGGVLGIVGSSKSRN